MIPGGCDNNDTTEEPILSQCCCSEDVSPDRESNEHKRSMSSRQVSFDSISTTANKRDTITQNHEMKELASTSLGRSMCSCQSSSHIASSNLTVSNQGEENVLSNEIDASSCNLDEKNNRILENEMNRRSPDNSLVDDMDDADNDESPPPPPPPPLQTKSSKFLRRQSMPCTIPTEIVPVRRLNRVSLHIYDLISSDTLMQLPWGCVCEIGKCFNEVNSALHELGTGAYHVGIECNGIEYAYGACSQPNKTGVFSCIPKLSPGYQYRTSIDFGYIPLIRSSWIIVPPTKTNDHHDNKCSSPRSVTSTSSSAFHYQEEYIDGRLVIKEMAAEYMGIDYDILKRNCCTFAADACVRLGVPEDDVPTWFRNLAETGAYSHTNFVEPLQHVLSGVGQPNNSQTIGLTNYHSKRHNYSGNDLYSHYTPHQPYNNCSYNNNNDPNEPGFELIAKRNASNTRDVVVVIDATTDTLAGRPFRSYRKSVTTVY
jgi:PPPDE putative peptidase domain